MEQFLYTAPVSTFDQGLSLDASKAMIVKWKKQWKTCNSQWLLPQSGNSFLIANKYIDETTPWAAVKDEARQEELARTMNYLAETCTRIIAVAQPFLTETQAKSWHIRSTDSALMDYLHYTFGVILEKELSIWKRTTNLYIWIEE